LPADGTTDGTSALRERSTLAIGRNLAGVPLPRYERDDFLPPLGEPAGKGAPRRDFGRTKSRCGHIFDLRTRVIGRQAATE
jgi:hypothetical protein